MSIKNINYESLLDTVIESMLNEGEKQEVAFSMKDLFISVIVNKAFNKTKGAELITNDFNACVRLIKEIVKEHPEQDSFHRIEKLVYTIYDLWEDGLITIQDIHDCSDKIKVGIV